MQCSLASAALVVLSAAPAAAQCSPEWSTEFVPPGLDGDVRALCVFDDGAGPALYVGGTFTYAGSVLANGIARFDGLVWSALAGPAGPGTNGAVHGLAVHDDGSGAALYATGTFTTAGGQPAARVARWNGSGWSALGAGISYAASGFSYGNALLSHDSGTGPELWVTGAFNVAGTTSVYGIARWSGGAWSAAGGGMHFGPGHDLAVYDSGNGPELYVCGNFDEIAGVPARYVARWDGSAWHDAGNTDLASVRALAVHDDGTGPRLYAGGFFTNGVFGGVPASGVARWNGASWQPVGAGLSGIQGYVVQDLLSADLGAGPRLVATGAILASGATPLQHLAAWNGADWQALGALSAAGSSVPGWALGMFDAGAGPRLHVGGLFPAADGTVVLNLARLDGAGLAAVGTGEGASSVVRAFVRHDDGAAAGPALYVGGEFGAIGGVAASGVARFDGTWSALGGGIAGAVHALASFDEGAGPRLFAAGQFTTAGGVPARNVARWDGAAWSALGPGLGATVLALLPHNDGSGLKLYAAGYFVDVAGQAGRRIARWNGATQAWEALGSIGATGFGDKVRCLASYQGELVIGGGFLQADGLVAPYAARWNGTAWQSLGPPSSYLDKDVIAMQVWQSPGGPLLYLGGVFGWPHYRVAAWDGTAVVPAFPAAFPLDNVYALAVHDDGSGAALYAAGRVDLADAQVVPGLARSSGGAWTAVTTSITSPNTTEVFALASHHAAGDAHPALWMGGNFRAVDGAATSRIARRDGCAEPATPFCLGDGSATACPCGNASAPGAGEGCLHSLGTGGRIDVTGLASITVDQIELRGSRMPSSTAVYIQGSARQSGGAGAVFGDGLRCVGGSVIRLRTKVNAAGASRYPEPGEAPVSVRGFVPAGSTRHYQVWFRNAAAFCTPSTFNLTNGASVAWSG